MTKEKSMFVCSNCKETFAKWLGRCPGCGAWGTMQEQTAEFRTKKKNSTAKVLEMSCINDEESEDSTRFDSGFVEINRVLGGGLVEGGLTLICGEPGMGKSTLLLQICDRIKITEPIFYFSGEENTKQIKLRANRLKITNENIFLFSNTNIEAIEETVKQKSPGLVVIDSIQTVQCKETAFTSSISQVKEATVRLMQLAKEQNVMIFVVGHVNKEGALAGPKVLEHIVDTVLYLEGERSSSYRILRTVKNRFGPTSEVAILDMEENGLVEIEDPATAMLDDNHEPVPGTCVTCLLEGTRVLFLEIQALVTKSSFAMPRRMATGIDYNRICVLLAVLEKRLGLNFGSLDAYVNVVGGFRLNEPGADLAIVLALLSTVKDKPIIKKTVAFGEVDLTGGVRSIANAKLRVQEAQRLGFERCILPKTTMNKFKPKEFKIELMGIQSLKELKSFF